MSSSEAANATSSHQEQREQKVLDVMFLCDEWKSSKGGLSTFNREFAINLAEATTGSMKIHCYVSNSDDQDREDAEQHGVNLITARSVPGSADPLECLKFPPSKLPKPHLVIGHGRKLGSPAYSLVQITKCKWIQFVHVYCEDLGKYKESATAAEDTIEENEEKHKMEIELCKAADAVVAVGSRLQQKYSRRLLNVEVKIITPGIFGKFSSESKLAVDRSVVKNFNVSMFGRAAFEDLSLKGYDLIANAIGSLGKNFELTFVGSSPGEQRKVEQWFLDNTCINRNQLTIRRYCSEQEELKVMFYQSDLVALPSRTEGFGLVALEAISAGVPVLVSGESGIAEALQKVEGGNTVIVGSDEDESEWTRRIREMYEESAEEREANAAKLRENYRKVYSWKAECERFKGLIEKVVENDQKLNVKVDVEKMKLTDHDAYSTASVSAGEPAGYQKASTASGTKRKRRSDTDLEDLQPLKEKVLCLIAMNYLDTTPPQSMDEHNKFQEYLQKMKVLIMGVSVGSLVITVKCKSLASLEELWEDYSRGLLDEMVQDCFVTKKILKELNLAELKLKTTIDVEEYNAYKLYFLEKDAFIDVVSSEFHSASSTSESLQIQEELKTLKQKTKVVETEKIKGTSPLTVIPSAGHRKELMEEGQGRKGEQEGMLPPHGSSTSDPEKKLEELHMNLKKQVTCSICLDTYTEPKIISCHHTFCCECLEKHAIVSQRQGKFRCPECQVEINLPEGNRFDCLPNSFFHKSLLSVLQAEDGKGTSPSNVPFTAGHKKKWEVRHSTGKFQEKEGSSPPPLLSTTDLEEKIGKVCEDIKMLRMEGSSPHLSTVEVELQELVKKLQKGRLEGSSPPPLLSTTDLEEKLGKVCKEIKMLRIEGSSPPPVSTVEVELDELLKKLQKVRMKALENAMYPTIRSGLARFDVSLPEELQSYISYLLYASATLGLRRRVLQSPRAMEELREAMDEDELKTFLITHIKEDAWQVVLLFIDEQATHKLSWDWYHEVWDEDEDGEMFSLPLYSSSSGILKAWPIKHDHDLITLCKAITNRDWKVNRLILSDRQISNEGFKNLSTALTQSELYSLTLSHIGSQRQGLKHLCEALISGDCNLTSLKVKGNWLGDNGLMQLCNALTSVNCTLTSLNVSEDWLGDEGMVHLCNALTSVDCTLTSLNVSDNWLGGKGMVHLCNALTSVNCTLTSLNVSRNLLRDEGIMHLCNALTSVDCTLTSLNVSDNWFGSEGMVLLCNALTSVNCTLTSLNVSENWPGDEGIKYLGKALTDTNCKLRSLNL